MENTDNKIGIIGIKKHRLLDPMFVGSLPIFEYGTKADIKKINDKKEKETKQGGFRKKQVTICKKK